MIGGSNSTFIVNSSAVSSEREPSRMGGEMAALKGIEDNPSCPAGPVGELRSRITLQTLSGMLEPDN